MPFETSLFLRVGVIILTFFDLSYGIRDFWGRCCQNVEFSTPKPWLGMTPLKVRIPMLTKVLKSKKYGRGPPKNEFRLKSRGSNYSSKYQYVVEAL